MTQIILDIDNLSAAHAIRSLVKNMIGVKIVSDTQRLEKESSDISSKDDLTERITKSLKQVKMIKEGKLPRRTVQDMINEL